jgi:hypothetical protein
MNRKNNNCDYYSSNNIYKYCFHYGSLTKHIVKIRACQLYEYYDIMFLWGFIK